MPSRDANRFGAACGALLVALLLAGCTGLDCGRPYPGDARLLWTEPGLHAALPDAAKRANATLVVSDLTEGLPLRSEALDARIGPHALRQAKLQGRASGFDEARVGPEPDRLVVMASVRDDNATVLALAHAFLENASLDATPGWDAALLAGGRDGLWEPQPPGQQQVVVARTYDASLPAQPDFTALFASLTAGGIQVAGSGGGYVAVSAAPWTFSFQVPEATLTLGNATLVVDPTDHVTATVHLSGQGDQRLESEARVRDLFAALGLPPPTFREESGGYLPTC